MSAARPGNEPPLSRAEGPACVCDDEERMLVVTEAGTRCHDCGMPVRRIA